MSDSHYCYVHWRDTDLLNVDTEWESEDLPDEVYWILPMTFALALFEQQMLEMEQKWTDMDLPMAIDTIESTLGDLS
ncbi:hypothetical protein BGX28_006055 [Mortierella sp. GBA30]|nr:hypothetical protein BGX28_006055 [Mortierella sp. GBA30]